MSAAKEQRYLDFLHQQIRDMRTVLEALHDSEPWVSAEDFKGAFTESDLGDLYDDLFGDAAER